MDEHQGFMSKARAGVSGLSSGNIRDYGMYFAFAAIVIFFTITTNGLFLSARNIGDLINGSAYIAVLAIGMTLVIVIRHIDLSVGFLSGALGAVAALALRYWGFPIWATILLVLSLGVAAGSATGYLVAKVKIPAFVATLGGWLLYKGIQQLLTRSTGTIVIQQERYKALGQGFIPDFSPGVGFFGLHKLTLVLGALAIAVFILNELWKRSQDQKHGTEVSPMGVFAVKLVFIATVIGTITWLLARYRGLSWAEAILIAVVLVYSFITTKTTTGRHIYAVGGNPEAAQLNGISVSKITFLVFCSMGLLTGLAGILYSSWLGAASTTAGTGVELDAIAAAFVGGAAVSGGVGKVTGSVIGALVMASLTKGMQLMTVDISIQYIVRAMVLVAAVVFDVTTRRKK